MRFPIARKIWLGCAVIVGLATVALLVAYRGLLGVQREMRHLADVKEPIKTAAHEMEINIKGIAIGALAYLSSQDPVFRELEEDARTDFEEFHAAYKELASTDQERAFGEQIGLLYNLFRKKGLELKDMRDRQTVAFAAGLAKLEEIDKFFDQHLPAALNPDRPSYPAKLESLGDIDEGIDAIRMLVATYRWSRTQSNPAQIEDNIALCQNAFQRLKGFQWAVESHKPTLLGLEEEFAEAMELIRQVLADENRIHDGIAEFLRLRDQIDDLLDVQVQPLAASLVRHPREVAERLTNRVVTQMGWLIPVMIIAAMAACLALTRTVTIPLNALAQGTEIVRRGDLAHRLPSVSHDEFADLTDDFNRMVARLQETLVSKDMLERSEQALRQTVQALRQEILERIRGEQERIRLEASLRRAETLSAMGTLVAGVAHQIRNPLFGISSVLDAMEARFGEREEFQKYMPVLREQIERVSDLMRELIEYGRVGNAEDAMEPVDDVVRQAVHSCQAMAAAAEVEVETLMNGSSLVARMDRRRLHRALENMLENAIHFSPRRTKVTVSVRNLREDDRDWAEISVEDLGPGFKEDDLSHVFEPFFTRRSGGTGLGLALVERIFTSHGGSVEAANRPEGGAIVTARIPIETTDILPVHAPVEVRSA